MTGTIRIFINGTGVDVPYGSSALDAVGVWDSAAASELRAGTQLLTDSRGLPTDGEQVVHAGTIFRLLPVRNRTSPENDD